MSSFLVTEEKKQEQLILIVDKEDRFGSLLAQQLLSQATVVLVSEKTSGNSSVIHVPFASDAAHIPDGTYSHIFFIWDYEKTSLDLLKSLLDKAYETGARFLFVCDYHAYSESLGEKIQRDGVVSALVLTGDIYDGKTTDQQLFMLFRQAKEESRIQLAHMGLEPVHITTKAETLHAILQAGLGSSKVKLYFAFAPHPQTLLTIAHALQQVEPLLKIDFVEGEHEHAIQALPKGEYIVHEQISVQDLQKAFQEYVKELPDKEKKEEQKITAAVMVPSFLTAEKSSPKSFTTKKKKGKKWGGVFFLLCLVLLPFLFPVSAAWTGVLLLQHIEKTTSVQDNIQSAVTQATFAKKAFIFAQQTDPVLLWTLHLVQRNDVGESFSVNVSNGSLVSDALAHFLTAFASYQQITGGKAVLPDVAFNQAVTSLQSGILSLQKVNTTSQYAQEKQQLQQAKKYTHVFADTLPILSQLLGMQKKQTYLIVFQNNMELRPSGGFIGSYGLVSVDKGQVGKLTIHNVYDADGQLKGHIEPPFAIRRYLPLVHWYLRDSGFDVDFSKSAAEAAYFLKQETGEQVDGVIALDLSFVQQLIASVGHVSVPEYNETVTPDNFFLLTESHAEKNSFAGSTQKQDFLQTVFAHLQDQLFTKHIAVSHVLSSLQDALTQKHLLLTLADSSIQDVFTVNGFSSSLWDNRTAFPNTVLDFTGINEANLGVNKVNYFVKRTADQHMTVYPSGTISGELTLQYTNTSKGEWPGGDYKNYLRFILPDGAVLRSVAVEGVDQRLQAAITNPSLYEAKSFKPPFGLEVERAQEEGKVLYGFLVTVPHQQSKSIYITYDETQSLDLTKPATFSELLFKQPGMLTYPYTWSLTFPTQLQIGNLPTGFVQGESVITKQFPFDQDTSFNVPFSLQ